MSSAEGEEFDLESFGESFAEGHTGAEGFDSVDSTEAGSASNWREMMFSTEPDEPLEAVDDPWNPEEGGVTRIWRGVKKMAGFDGTPAIMDVVIGVCELVTNPPENGGEAETEEPSEEPTDEDSEVV